MYLDSSNESELFFGVGGYKVLSSGLTPMAFELILKEKNDRFVRSLIKNKKDLNQQDLSGYTPLMMASMIGNFDGVKQLIEAGADVNLTQKEGKSALWFAAFNGCKDVVSLLVKKGADIELMDKKHNQTPLMVACDYGHYDCVNALIKLGADVNHVSQYGQTALSYAIIGRKRNINIVKKLVEKGADIHNEPQGGERIYTLKPLPLAVRHKNLLAIRFLLQKGASGKEDALKVAKERGDKEIQYMIEKNGNVKIKIDTKKCLKTPKTNGLRQRD